MKQQNKKINLRVVDKSMFNNSSAKSEDTVEELVEVEASSPDTTESFAGVCADLSFEEKLEILAKRNPFDQFITTYTQLSYQFTPEVAMKMCEGAFGKITTNI